MYKTWKARGVTRSILAMAVLALGGLNQGFAADANQNAQPAQAFGAIGEGVAAAEIDRLGVILASDRARVDGIAAQPNVSRRALLLAFVGEMHACFRLWGARRRPQDVANEAQERVAWYNEQIEQAPPYGQGEHRFSPPRIDADGWHFEINPDTALATLMVDQG